MPMSTEPAILPGTVKWVPAKGRWCSAAGKVTTGLVESNGSLLPGGWLIVTCGLTACTPGSAPGAPLGNDRVWEAFTFAFIMCYAACCILHLAVGLLVIKFPRKKMKINICHLAILSLLMYRKRQSANLCQESDVAKGVSKHLSPTI